MIDVNALIRKLDTLIREGRTDEEAIAILYRDGEGQLPIGYAYSSYRKLARIVALHQVRKWTNDMERLPQPPRRSILKREIREAFDDAVESGGDEV